MTIVGKYVGKMEVPSQTGMPMMINAIDTVRDMQWKTKIKKRKVKFSVSTSSVVIVDLETGSLAGSFRLDRSAYHMRGELLSHVSRISSLEPYCQVMLLWVLTNRIPLSLVLGGTAIE